MPRLITDYLEESARKYPEKVAVMDEHRSLTFAGLREEARRIGSTLARKGLFHQPVAVYLEQSVSSVAAFLGIAYSGNFYTVLDTKMPSSRLRRILDILRPGVVITDRVHGDAPEVLGGGHRGFTLRRNSSRGTGRGTSF